MKRWHFDIEMIGGLDAEKISYIDRGSFDKYLVKQQNMGFLERQQCECYTRLLPSTECSDWLKPAWGRIRFVATPSWMHLPSHSTNLKISEMWPIFLFAFPRKFRRKELNRAQSGVQGIYMMLSKITTRGNEFETIWTEKDYTYTRRRPLRVTCPAIGSNSPVKTLILKVIISTNIPN